jgi:hypothetical protein
MMLALHRSPRSPRAPGLIAAGVVLLLAGAPAQAQLGDLLKGVVEQQRGLSEEQVGKGLKEALQVATDKSVNLTGRTDGYFGNPAIRIPMPEKLQSLEKGLRMVGYGPQADEFVLSMNRAAEQSAPAARQIFLDAVTSMSFDDARKILKGGNTSATDFFKAKTSDKLRAAFAPIVKRNLDEVGVTRRYEALTERFNAIPFMHAESFDLDGYVVGMALQGLFHVIGEQEKDIRANPAARTTALLREVFGS